MRNDTAYNNMDFIPDGPAYPDRWADAARDWREVEAAVGRARLNLAYGAADRQRFDLFYPAGRPKGLIFLIHGATGGPSGASCSRIWPGARPPPAGLARCPPTGSAPRSGCARSPPRWRRR
jgi:hypothetical protein